MNEQPRVIPPRIFRVTFKTTDGRSYWRYIKCPYQVRSPEDWADSLVGVQTSLAELTLEQRIARFSISLVASDRINKSVRDHLHRWTEVYASLLAA